MRRPQDQPRSILRNPRRSLQQATERSPSPPVPRSPTYPQYEATRGAGPPSSPDGSSHSSRLPRDSADRGRDRSDRNRLSRFNEDDEGGYRRRLIDGRDAYDRSDDDIRKLNKTFEMHFAKIKFKGGYYENWELYCDEYVAFCERQRVSTAERVLLFPIALSGNAKLFYINEIQRRPDGDQKPVTWGEIVKKFTNRFSSEVKRERMSTFLQTVQVYQFEQTERGAAQALEKLIAQLEKIAPMAMKRDRTDEAKVVFLKRAVMSRSWGVSALASLKGQRYSYQDLIDALFSSIADQDAHAESLAREQATGGGEGGFRKSCWKSKGNFREGLFANQRRLAVDPRTIQRGSASTSTTPTSANTPNVPSTTIRLKSPCFNCEREGCRLGTCKKPKDRNRIQRNLAKFRKERDAARAARRVNFAIQEDDLYEELAIGLEEILIADVYGTKPAMSVTIASDPEDESEGSSIDEDDGDVHESMHTGLAKASEVYGEETSPWEGSAAEDDEPTIAEILACRKQGF